MNLIQIFILAFVVFALVKSIKSLRDQHITRGWFAFWMLFWIAAGVVTALPQTASMVATILGVGRGADAIIYLSFVVLFYLVFRLFAKIEDVERDLTKLVRKIALEDLSEDR